MSKKTLITSLIIYLVSAGLSFSTFSYFDKSTEVIIPEQAGVEDESFIAGALLEIDPGAPQDQPCPLSGKLFTQVERDAWEARRPLFVMVENHPDARPQSGLSRADVVFEAIAEGGVTRFGVMYYCAAQVQDILIAPVRSARTYFVDWASGFNLPMYVHIGGANVPGPTDALGQISDYGWNMQNDINQFSVGYPTFVRDYNRIPGKELATEHTMVSTTEKLWKVAAKRDWTNMSPDRKYGRKTIEGTDWNQGYQGWSFEEEPGERGDVTTVSYDFWSGYGDYSIKWDYDAELDAFKRTMGGELHVDFNNNEVVTAANVIVLLTTEKGPINEKKHMIYGTTGRGTALIFKHGDVIKATWNKKTRESELTFSDRRGQEVELARGMVWISVLNKANEVEY